MSIPRLPLFLLAVSALGPASLPAQINTVQTVGQGVYFHEGDPRRGHSNNGWIVFDDFVLVIDANYPSGAQIAIPKVKETTDKPIRFVLNTHHHADHAYGNQLWADLGATLIATTSALEEMKKVETGFFGGEPGRWEASAKVRPDVAATKLKPPLLLFPKDLIFDDGHRRVELHWFGVGHTPGDGYAWMPKEKILFTGDACVNGPHNNVNDGNVGEWIKTLELVKQLGAEKVCPGHGPMGGPEIIVDQQAYFVGLEREVKALVDAHKTAAEVKAAVPAIAAELKKTPNIARYVPTNLTAHVQKVYLELGGQVFPSDR
ncbi:MAG TPA: MBL fold metallo-hydrolase [Opitutaceae bacterium]|nr:MBL fold metallo-hydrolase [Opitutaceae bacterium]